MKKTIREQLDTAAKKYAKQEAAGSRQVEEAYIDGAKWWNSNSQKPLKQYVKDIEKAIIDREGIVKPFLNLQVQKTARLWQMRDRLAAELDFEDSFMMIGQGSMTQLTKTIDPRLTSLEKLERTLTSDLAALGLNYNATPSKIKENTKQGGEKQDRLQSTLDKLSGK